MRVSAPRPSHPSLARRLVAVALSLAPAAALAQDPALVDDAIPSVASAPRRMEVPVEQVAGSITVIYRDEIERRQLRTLPDVLRTVPGVKIAQAGGVGKQTSIFTRGTESNHTLVLLDGIDISDPSLPGGTYDPAHLLTENLERIEVMRGPMSSLYGSDAVGGVINLVTRKGSGKPRFTAWAEYGSFKTVQQSTSVQGSNDRVNYALNFTTLHTRGETQLSEDLGGDERDGYDNTTVSGRIGFTPTRQTELTLVGRYVDTEGDLDPFLDDPDAEDDTSQLFLRSEGRLELLGGKWQQRLGVGYTDYDRDNSNDPDDVDPERSRSSNDGTRLKVDWQHDFLVGRSHVVTLGAETERETIDSSFSSESPFSLFDSGSDESLRTSAVFLQEQFSSALGFFGAAGLRLEDNEEFGSELTYRVAAGYADSRFGTRVHASIATAFKAPSLEDLYGSSTFTSFGFTSIFNGNPDLDPEKSRGWEIGIEQPLFGERVRLGSTYFQNRVRDLIQVTSDFTTLENVGRAKTDGFESFVSLELGDRLLARIDHTYVSAEDRDTGQDLLRRPAHTLNSRLEVVPIPKATLSLDVQYVGPRKDVDPVTFERISVGGYTVVDTAASYDVNANWRIFGRLDNLFDREYRDPAGFQSSGFAGFIGLRATY
jgi:vitamin B12 transporter